MKKFLFVTCVGFLLVFAGCSASQSDEADTINKFFDLIDKGELDSALEMAHSSVDDVYMQVWHANFSALNSVEVKEVIFLEEESAYQVALLITLKEGAKAFRWHEEGLNFLLFTLEQENEEWRIAKIANGIVTKE